MRQYSVTVTRLVATLLREGSPLPLPVSDALRAALVSLRHRLCVAQDAEISDLHAVLSLLWLTEWRCAGMANSISDPTLAFLAMFAVKADSTYIDAKAFTTPLALPPLLRISPAPFSFVPSSRSTPSSTTNSYQPTAAGSA